MTLLQARLVFTKNLWRLGTYATDILGLDVIINETMRSREAAKWNSEHCKVWRDGKRCEKTRPEHVDIEHAFRPIGIANSVHCNGLAVDILIMKDGQISNDPEYYTLLGEWWEKQFPAAAWGGRFNDMGHFSHAWRGRK